MARKSRNSKFDTKTLESFKGETFSYKNIEKGARVKTVGITKGKYNIQHVPSGTEVTIIDQGTFSYHGELFFAKFFEIV